MQVSVHNKRYINIVFVWLDVIMILSFSIVVMHIFTQHCST